MNIIDFIANAGKKITEDEAPLTPEETSIKLVNVAKDLDLDTEGIEIKAEGDTAVISGNIMSQMVKEKLLLAIGNTMGIAKVQDMVEVENPEPASVYYTVKKGDTLSAIAKEQYKDGNKYMVIFEANTPMLKNPDDIFPGQVLRIPPLAE